MVMHPWRNLRRIQGLERLPDRRSSKSKFPVDPDPLRAAGQSQAIHKALGLYAQEESRVELYESYREMDHDPVISGVLDAFGEDAAQLDPEHGRIVWPTADNSDVKQIVTRCLDRVGVDAKAFPTMRQLARDGDVLTHVAGSRGQGVIALKAYDPWAVARIEDDIGRLTGFAPSDDRGNPNKAETNAVPYYKVLHYRLPARDLTDIYGAQASFLWPARITWRELQLMLDQVVMQRLLRRPDRLMLLVDTVGMSHDDAHWFIEDLKRRMHREWHLNPSGGGMLGGSSFQSTGLPPDDGLDFVMPRGPNNSTSVENFPATNQNDLLRDVDLFFRQLANGVGFPHGFIGSSEGRYNPEQSLSRQHQPFAKRAARLQRSYLQETVRLCMIDMAYQGLDPTKDAHSFTLHMAPVSPILEMERHEVMQMKLDRLERALRLGQDNQFDQDFWVPFVLTTYGHFPKDVVEQMFKGSGGGVDDGASSGGMAFERAMNGNGKRGAAPPNLKALTEAVRERLPDPSDKPYQVGSRSVLGGLSSTHELSGGMALVEWRNASDASKKSSAPSIMTDTQDLDTRIVSRCDEAAARIRRERREARMSVVNNLMGSGRIFDS